MKVSKIAEFNTSGAVHVDLSHEMGSHKRVHHHVAIICVHSSFSFEALTISPLSQRLTPPQDALTGIVSCIFSDLNSTTSGLPQSGTIGTTLITIWHTTDQSINRRTILTIKITIVRMSVYSWHSFLGTFAV